MLETSNLNGGVEMEGQRHHHLIAPQQLSRFLLQKQNIVAKQISSPAMEHTQMSIRVSVIDRPRIRAEI